MAPLTLTEACRRVGMTKRTYWRRRREGRGVPFEAWRHPWERRYMVDRMDVDRAVAQRVPLGETAAWKELTRRIEERGAILAGARGGAG